MKQFFARRWFLILLVIELAIGFTWHAALNEFAAGVPRDFVVAATLFFMALPLDIRAMWRALRFPAPTLLAVFVNSAIVPVLAWLVAPLLAQQLGDGLIIMAAIPCTLASAAVWTRRGGGNDAVAILVTMITNLLCFAVTPAWIRLLTDTEADLSFIEISRDLLLTVVLPIVLAQLLRIYAPFATWATARKPLFGICAQCGILTIIFVGAVSGGENVASKGGNLIGWVDWGKMLLAVNAVHVAALALGHLAAFALRMKREDRIAVGFAGSQKTLAVGLAIGMKYFSPLTIMPMIAFHVCQLIVDTLVVDKLRQRAAHAAEAEPAAPTPS